MLTEEELIKIGKEQFGIIKTRTNKCSFKDNYDLIRRILEDSNNIPYLNTGPFNSDEGKIFIRKMSPVDKKSELTVLNFNFGLEQLNKNPNLQINLDYLFSDNGIDTSKYVDRANFFSIYLGEGSKHVSLSFMVRGFGFDKPTGKYHASASFQDYNKDFVNFINSNLGPNRE